MPFMYPFSKVTHDNVLEKGWQLQNPVKFNFKNVIAPRPKTQKHLQEIFSFLDLHDYAPLKGFRSLFVLKMKIRKCDEIVRSDFYRYDSINSNFEGIKAGFSYNKIRR
jgi:hypothetical protein